MRDSLKNIFSDKITLEDNSQFYFTIKPYELINSLDNNIVVLQEYSFIKKDDNNGQFSCKLYRTKEGNWYEVEEAKTIAQKTILRSLKSCIRAKENKTV